MSDKEYQKFIEKYTPKPPILINAITTFVAGGIVGLSSELLLEVYEFFLKIPRKESGILVILTLITISSILTRSCFIVSRSLIVTIPVSNVSKSMVTQSGVPISSCLR